MSKVPRIGRAATDSIPAKRPVAVLVDGSALYFASRSFGQGKSIDYRALVDLLCRLVPGLVPAHRDSTDRWVMWTAAAQDNPGQNRFLEFAQKDLGWSVRKYAPPDSFMVEPLFVLGSASGADSKLATRLIRFDASIAFAMGRLAETHRFVVISDSFAISDSLIRAAKAANRPASDCYMCYFGRALDPRWQRHLRSDAEYVPTFIDLDEHVSKLFGLKEEEVEDAASRDSDDYVF